MCTVTFLPVAGGYLLAHNRDESFQRARGVPPHRHVEEGRAFVAPRDPDGRGSWIGMNDAGVTTCVLNAAETNPSRLPAAPTSRGLVLWSLLPLGSIDGVRDTLLRLRSRLGDVRAFQIVVAEPPRGRSAPAATGWMRWDGARLTSGRKDGPAIYVSSGYDQGGAERERARSWTRFVESLATGRGREEIRREARGLRSLMRSHEPAQGPLSVCMHGPHAATVSSSLVTVAGGRAALRYHDGRPCDGSAPEVVRALPLR
ncbi:MAG: NRDE family protein [Acidobacteria bacterium]|nr:NRDE family protein [Acidobacteriota bacterium]